MFGPLRRLASWFIFLHFNSNVDIGRLSIFAMCLQHLGTVISFTFVEVVRGNEFLRSMRKVLSWLVQNRVYDSSTVQTFYLQLIVVGTFVLSIAALFLVKQFGARPPGIITRVVVNLVELTLFVFLNVLSVPTFFAFTEQMYYFMFVSESPSSPYLTVASCALSVVLMAAIVFAQILYASTMDDHRFKRSYMFYSHRFFAAHYLYVLAATVLYSIVRQRVWIVHGLMTLYSLVMLFSVMRNNTFCMTSEILFMLGFVIFTYFLAFALGLLMTLGLFFHVTFEHIWLVFGIFVISILVSLDIVDKKNHRINYHDQFVNFHSWFRPQVRAYQDQPLRVDCGISRNFLFQLACFFGPEYFG